MDPQTTLSISEHRLDKDYSDPSGVDLSAKSPGSLCLLCKTITDLK